MSIMKNAFHFNLKVISTLKIFKSCADFFGHVGRRLDKRAKVSFKIYDITKLVTNNFNTNFTEYLKKKMQSNIKFGLFIKNNMRKIFLQISCRK